MSDSLTTPAVTDFTTYVAERRPALLRTARGITGDPHSAEDLLQSALATVFPHWDSLRHPRAADAYVRRAMFNRHSSWWRQQWRRRESPWGELPEPEARWFEDDWPEGDLGLWRLVATLPPRQREAVVLRYYEGMSLAEIARVQRCSIGTVKSNTSRGLATLRRMIAEAGIDVVEQGRLTPDFSPEVPA